MVKRIFGIKSKTVGSAAILLSVASLASRLFGLVRDRLLAGTFGAGSELDVYYAAFRIPDFVYSLFVFGAISAAFIPVFAKFSDENEDNNRDGGELISRVLTLMAWGLAILAALGFVLAPYFTPFITPGFDSSQVALTVKLTRIMFLSPVLLGLSGVLGAVLQVRKRFLVYSLAPVLYNIGIITGTIFFTGRLGVTGVAWGVVLGAVLHFAIQASACGSLSLSLKYDANYKHPSIREIIRLTIPRIASLAATNVYTLTATSMITALGVGSLAVFNFSMNLIYVPINMIGVSIAVAAFPFISELAEKNKKSELSLAINQSIRTIMFFAIPAMVGFLLLRAQIVRIVLGSGSFDWADTIATADVLAFLTLGLFACVLTPLLIRSFFALKDSVTPLLINVIVTVFGIALAWLSVRLGYGVVGVVGSMAVTNILSLVILWVALRFKLGSLGEARILRAVAVMSICGLAMAAAIQTVKLVLGPVVDMRSFVGIFTQGFVSGLVGLMAYAGSALALGSHEAKQAVDMIRRRLVPVSVDSIQKEESIVPEL